MLLFSKWLYVLYVIIVLTSLVLVLKDADNKPWYIAIGTAYVVALAYSLSKVNIPELSWLFYGMIVYTGTILFLILDALMIGSLHEDDEVILNIIRLGQTATAFGGLHLIVGLLIVKFGCMPVDYVFQLL